jgi:hypothetical protein
MIYNFINKTAQIQEILLIDGNSLKVLPGEVIELAAVNIFPYEKERCLKFFNIEEKVEKKKTYKGFSQPEPETKDESYGGIE